VACGVRKLWSKEFRGLDTPAAQIKRLKEILAGLGMEGRMSMDQAKAIREKRELAQELGELSVVLINHFSIALIRAGSRGCRIV
jgi:hypothetical protein